MSALVGDSNPNPQIFEIENSIPRIIWVCSHESLKLMSLLTSIISTLGLEVWSGLVMPNHLFNTRR